MTGAYKRTGTKPTLIFVSSPVALDGEPLELGDAAEVGEAAPVGDATAPGVV